MSAEGTKMAQFGGKKKSIVTDR